MKPLEKSRKYGSVILVSELRWAPDDVCRPFYRLIGKMWKFLISATSPGACKNAAAFPRQSFSRSSVALRPTFSREPEMKFIIRSVSRFRRSFSPNETSGTPGSSSRNAGKSTGRKITLQTTPSRSGCSKMILSATAEENLALSMRIDNIHRAVWIHPAHHQKKTSAAH